MAGGGVLFGGLLIISYNAWLVTRGLDARAQTVGLLRSLAAADGPAIGIVLGELLLLAVVAAVGIRICAD